MATETAAALSSQLLVPLLLWLQVRLRVTTRVINNMHSEEEMRRQVLVDDR